MSDWDWPRLIAHRCGGALAPENTLAGLDIAKRLGCVAVEFDVMLSGDGEPILIHDETLDRTAGRSGLVAELSAAQLTATDVGASHHRAFAGETVPTLAVALERCIGLGLAVNLEIKPAVGYELATGREVGRRLAAAGVHLPPVLLSSFSPDAVLAAAERVPDLPRGLLAETFGEAALAKAQSLGCAALNVGRDTLQAAHVAAVRGAGLRCLVYTVNDPGEARRLFGWNVDGIFSDRPDQILPILAERAPR